MGRIRTLKPELLEDTRTASLSDAAFRLFVASVLLADDHGNLRADERWLSGQVWWARGGSPQVAEILRELAEAELILAYRVREQMYVHLRGWSKHQRIDNAGKPRVPGPSDPDALTIPDVDSVISDDSRNSAANLREIPLDLRPPTSDLDLLSVSSKPRKTRSAKSVLPPDWEPERSTANMAAEQLAQGRGVDLSLELTKMRDWAASNNSKKIDWNATWRNWTRNAKPLSGSRGKPLRPKQSELIADIPPEIQGFGLDGKGPK